MMLFALATGSTRNGLALGLTCLCAAQSAPAQSCADLVAVGGFRTEKISGDGEVVVGTNTATGPRLAAYWTGLAFQNLGTLGGIESVALDVAADGATIVGWADAASGSFAFRWTAAGGMQSLGTLGGASSKAYAVSRDGAIVVGESLDAAGVARAFLWTAGNGMQSLGSLGGASSSARDVSDDGRVVVGAALDSLGNRRAFRWTAVNGMQDLGGLSGNPSTEYGAVAVSGDGVVVVGSSAGYPPRAFRWTSAIGMQDLGTLPGGLGAQAFDVSADGLTVVGSADESPQINITKAFRWSPVEGMRDVGIVPGCCFLVEARATGVSSDGTVVVGIDGNLEAFRVRHSVVGENMCRPAVPNSSGCAGVLLAEGLPLAAHGSLQLGAALLPQHSFGFFLASRTQGFTAGVPNSQGHLCLAGSIGRFVGPGQIQNAGASGAFSLAIDLAALPTPTGPVTVQVGETWHFQAWFRDANPNPTSNFTDALRVLFQ